MFFRFYIDIVSEWVYDVGIDTVSEVLLQVMVLPKGSPEQTITRKRTIISDCKKLCQEMSFMEITILMIAEYTTFSRASIYNGF